MHTGILAVQSGAVGPLLQQISEGSLNAKKQLAILDASNTLSAEAPGGRNRLRAQPERERVQAGRIDVERTAASDTTRNVGIGLGGLALLVVAVGAGFMIGRRSSVNA